MIACQSVKEGLSLAVAAKTYGIPKSTLHSKVIEKVPFICKKGPATVLNAVEETRLKKWILDKAKLGFPMHEEEVKNAVQKVLNESERTTVFKDNRPGDKWVQLFLQRHPEIKKRNTEVLSKARASVTEENIRIWHRSVENYLKENSMEEVLIRPGSIFNGDETGVMLNPKSGKLLGPNQEKNFYEIATANEKENLTVLCTFSAAGLALPPLILFPYKRIPGHISESIPADWPIGRSDSGWMVSSTFYEYIVNIFYPWCLRNGVIFPVIYYLDGHKSHLSLELSDFCNAHQIILCALLPNSTHILQPCDTSIFRALKVKWRQVVQNHKQETEKNITKSTFAPLFQKAFDQISKDSIINGFKMSGLFPYDENAIDFSRCISTRRRERSPDVTTEEHQNGELVRKDYETVIKFFSFYHGDQKIKKFKDIKKSNKDCDEISYKLWEYCTNKLEKANVTEHFSEQDISLKNTNYVENDSNYHETKIVKASEENNDHVDCQNLEINNCSDNNSLMVPLDDLPIININNVTDWNDFLTSVLPDNIDKNVEKCSSIIDDDDHLSTFESSKSHTGIY